MNNENWYSYFGLDYNPFVIKPTQTIINYEKEIEAAKSYILSGNPFKIVGEYGTGKSSLLLHLKSVIKGGYKCIYIPGSLYNDEKSLFDKLKSEIGFLDRILRRKVVLLIDEGEALDSSSWELIKGLYESDKIYNFGVSIVEQSLPESIRDRIGDRKVVLNGLNSLDLVIKLVEKRIGKNPLDYYTKDLLQYVLENSKGIPRKILEILEKITVSAYKNKIKPPIDIKDVKIPEERKVEKLSPLQKKILLSLKTGPKTLKELSKELGSSVYTIGSQLSKLARKGYIKSEGTRPKRYVLIKLPERL